MAKTFLTGRAKAAGTKSAFVVEQALLPLDCPPRTLYPDNVVDCLFRTVVHTTEATIAAIATMLPITILLLIPSWLDPNSTALATSPAKLELEAELVSLR